MQIAGEDVVVVAAQPLCLLAAHRWTPASVAGLGRAEVIVREGLIVGQAKVGGLVRLRTITVSIFPT